MQGEKPFENGKMIKLYSGDRFMLAQYKEDGSVVMSGGGKFTLDEEGYTEVMDYFSEAPAQRGKPVTYRYTLTGNKFIIEAEMHGFTLKETWQKTDD